MAEHLIELSGVHAGYDGIAVVRNLDLHVDAGEVVALLGPNGAGKTTTLLTISHLLPALQGTVKVFGEDTADAKASALARQGLAHVTEERSLFFDLTVDENLLLGVARQPGRAEGIVRAGDGDVPGPAAAAQAAGRAAVGR